MPTPSKTDEEIILSQTFGRAYLLKLDYVHVGSDIEWLIVANKEVEPLIIANTISPSSNLLFFPRPPFNQPTIFERVCEVDDGLSYGQLCSRLESF